MNIFDANEVRIIFGVLKLMRARSKFAKYVTAFYVHNGIYRRKRGKKFYLPAILIVRRNHVGHDVSNHGQGPKYES